MHKKSAQQQLIPKVITQQLGLVYEQILKQYTRGISPTVDLPPETQTQFRENVEAFTRGAGFGLSVCTTSALLEAKDLETYLAQMALEVKGQLARFSNILWQLTAKLGAYSALQRFPDYPFYVFVSENKETTCDTCAEMHGRLFCPGDLQFMDTPPLHYQCRCRLVALDSQMAALYTAHKQSILDQLTRNLDALEQQGSIFILRHETQQQGIHAEMFLCPFPPNDAMVRDTEHNEPGWFDRLRSWGSQFLTDAKTAAEEFEAHVRGLYDHAIAVAEDKPFLGLLYYADAVLLGLPSGTMEGMIQRWENVEEHPDIVSVVNYLSLGMLDLADAAIHPDEPWSFEHVMNVLGVATAVFALSSGLKPRSGGRSVLDGKAPKGSEPLIAAQIRRLNANVRKAAQKYGKGLTPVSADDLNVKFLKENPGAEKPYWPGTQAYLVKLEKNEKFARVYGGGSGRNGQWVLRQDDIAGLSAREIQDKFSLPQMPEYICDVDLPAGTTMEISGAGAVMGGGGGGVQFRIEGIRGETWYANERILPKGD